MITDIQACGWEGFVALWDDTAKDIRCCGTKKAEDILANRALQQFMSSFSNAMAPDSDNRDRFTNCVSDGDDYRGLSITSDARHSWRKNAQFSNVVGIRPIKGIQGLTREVVVALLCNIESQEQRGHMITTRRLPPEHPRAGASDDGLSFT
uniref:Uncharacterized protein n=1 Tax=Branchiostoma floridae TaxID=7739 RepID=C3ZZT2_BRAFL|eukprot:XP_002585943.1 hypothetical protein BRAFLDRAFT_109116 [Branchiostoma floridae]